MGVVEELGPGTSGRLTKGQRVVAADWGQVTYQEYVAVDEKNLVHFLSFHLLGASACAFSRTRSVIQQVSICDFGVVHS